MGAFWNPNGGMVVGNQTLPKENVAEIKQKWSAQLQFSERPFDRWWRKFKRIMMISLQLK